MGVIDRWDRGGKGGAIEVADLELPMVVFPARSVVVSGVTGNSDSRLLQLLYKLCCLVCHSLYIRYCLLPLTSATCSDTKLGQT